MGSVRRRLTSCSSALLALIATPLLAEVCDKERPDWDGVTETAWSEAFTLFLSPLGLLLVALSVVAVQFRWQWTGLATILGWTAFITIVTMADPTGLRADAMAEGCIGPPTLFIALAAAICVMIVLRTKPRRAGDTEA
ncbi:MAG: hypothetical protein AAGL96_16635 [Pseudomonadota bacterium]